MKQRTAWRHALWIAACCFAVGSTSVSAAAPAKTARQPVERFARLPFLSQVTISPDGQRIAALMNRDGNTVLITRPLGRADATKGLLTTDNQKFYFNWIHWVNDERLLVSLRFASRRGFVGTVETRLLSIKADGSGGVVNLVQGQRSSGSMSGSVFTHQIQDRVIDWLPQDGKHVLLELAESSSGLPAIYKVNVETGRRTVVKAPERHVWWWFSDVQGRVRVGVYRHEGQYEVRASDPEGKAWRTLWSYKETKDRVWPIGFGLDPHELYVRAYHEGRLAVFSVRLDDPSLTRRLRIANAQFDIYGRLIHSPLTGEVLGLRTGGEDDEDAVDDGSRAELWNTAWRAQLKAVDQGLAGRENLLLDMSRDETRYLVRSSSARQPGEYYLGDRRSGELALVGTTYPDFEEAHIVGKRRVTIKARDGLALDAYLTLPRGRSQGDGGAALPMVLLPHGGPRSRDDGRFDTWTEFLADRGYLVLQVNFRGSDGYGHAFQTAGLKRWGLEMQDDLTDGVAWAVSQRLADPARVCIVGGSYGGYAALMGVVKTPELYRCAVSFAGVSDLPDLIAHDSDYIGGLEAAEEMIGRVWGDRERLRATSPARQAERIQSPVLLIHGSVDRRVPVEQSETMVSALKRAGKRYRYIEQEGGDHHLSRYEHRLQFFKALEAFLDENLQPLAAKPAAVGR
ncbi:MAG: S9 family peptidase [Rhizobacter sp.]